MLNNDLGECVTFGFALGAVSRLRLGEVRWVLTFEILPNFIFTLLSPYI